MTSTALNLCAAECIVTLLHYRFRQVSKTDFYFLLYQMLWLRGWDLDVTLLKSLEQV